MCAGGTGCSTMGKGIEKQEKAEEAVAAIRQRWGTAAIGRPGSRLAEQVTAIPTGFAALDAALGVGGIPRGRISELIGIPTSGMSTLALNIMAGAQAEGGAVVYFDVERTFDPGYARRCGVELAHMVLVHPGDASEALAVLADFVLSDAADLLVLDWPPALQADARLQRKLISTLGRLLAPLNKNETTLLFLSTFWPQGAERVPADEIETALLHFAAVRLVLHKARWLYRHRDVQGYEARVTVVKNKLSRPGQSVEIAIMFDDRLSAAEDVDSEPLLVDEE